MGFFSDRAQLDSLDAENRLRDARIEATRVKDMATLDVENMTIGEVITLANAIEAIRSITSDSGLKDVVQSTYTPPARAEKRFATDESVPFVAASGSYPSRSDAGYPFSATPAESDDEEAAREALYARLSALLSDVIPDDYEVNTVGGPVRFSDIPRDANGVPDSAWVEANCTCEDHERKRIDADRTTLVDEGSGSGLYL